MFIMELSTIDKTWKQPWCPWAAKWIKNIYITSQWNDSVVKVTEVDPQHPQMKEEPTSLGCFPISYVCVHVQRYTGTHTHAKKIKILKEIIMIYACRH